LVAARYCALTQRETPSRTISAQTPCTLPVTETLLPLSRTVSREPVIGAVQTLTSVVVYLLPVIFGGSTVLALSDARVFTEVGFGIGACFFRCFATGVVVFFCGAWVGLRSSGGRRASRLVLS
jgi:hypothetical protein